MKIGHLGQTGGSLKYTPTLFLYPRKNGAEPPRSNKTPINKKVTGIIWEFWHGWKAGNRDILDIQSTCFNFALIRSSIALRAKQMISLALEDQKPLVYNYCKEYEQRLIAFFFQWIVVKTWFSLHFFLDWSKMCECSTFINQGVFDQAS